MKTNDNYGFSDLTKFINDAAKNNLSMEGAAEELGLTNKQRDVLKLLIAREYYKEGNIKEGDKYLNTVESTKGKDRETIKLVTELRNMKKFLKYSDDAKVKTLVHIAPGKRY
jgi:hypothetical protein